MQARAVDDPEAVAVLREYTAEMADRYYGRPASRAEVDAVLAEDPSDGLAPPTGRFWIARHFGAPVGCAGLRRLEARAAEIKRMYIRPAARGQGLGSRLLAAVEHAAAEAGVAVLRLDTRRDLVEARGLYTAHGYTEIPAYHHGSHAELWFEKRIG